MGNVQKTMKPKHVESLLHLNAVIVVVHTRQVPWTAKCIRRKWLYSQETVIMINSSTNPVKGNSISAHLCSINICGLSQRSHMMLNKYVYDKDILLLSIQETGDLKNSRYKYLNDMNTFEDTNHQRNKGCAIMVKKGVMFTQLTELSLLSSIIDSVWGMLSWNGKNYIIGNIYLKLDCIQGVKDMLRMLDHAQTLNKLHKCCGIILMGDLNARHQLWNDTTINNYGKFMESNLDWTKFCVHDPGCPTFLAKNGNSLIDLFISTTALDPYLRNVRTDCEAILYSGAPLRGHVPVFVDLYSHYHKPGPTKVEYKLNLSTMDWDDWSLDIELLLRRDFVDKLSLDGEIDNLMALFDNAISSATNANCQTKKVCKHSKPYWTKELTTLSEKLRKALKCYSTRNTDDNLLALQEAKSVFEDARKQACQKFILDKTNTLNTAQACKFWKEFNRLFKPPSDTQVESLVKNDGSIITDNPKIEEEMFDTFFKGKHITENQSSFDSQFHDDTNDTYRLIKENGFANSKDVKDRFHLSSALYNPITEEEVWSTIKRNKSAAGSFDNCKVHPLMLKNLGPNGLRL